MVKVAIITGGASGIGLAVSKALAERQNEEWHVHILDFDGEQGPKVASSIKNATFHKVDVTDYSILSTTFDKIFKSEGRLDFVHANAGIVQRVDFYARHDDIEGPPPDPSDPIIDVNFKAVYVTSYLALNYFRRNKEKVDAALVVTASSAGIYPINSIPVYSATKGGVVQFMRSVASVLLKDGVRINAICPGFVKTNIMGPGGMDSFPASFFTPIETVVKAVLMLVDGKSATDGKGVEVKEGKVSGIAVEVINEKFYFRWQPEYCDEPMKQIFEGFAI